MYTYQQRLAYAKRIQQLQQAVVIKDNIHLTYKYKNQNKAIANAHSLQDKIIKSIVDNAVSGNADSIKNIDSQVEKLLTTTLENERKRIHNKKDHYIDNAVEQNSAKYSKILTNRINQEAFKLESKIESEIRSGIHKKLTEAETRQELLNKYGDTGKARIKNIIRDSIHTNESNISFIDALSKGYNYKVWMNGRGKGKTRPWHKANIITSVPIEEYFDIYGSYHAQLMYPGDLYGGAENVANCRCWLRYTNKVPENLKKKTTFNVNPSYQNIWDKTKNKSSVEIITKPLSQIKNKINIIKNKIYSKSKSNIDFNKIKFNNKYLNKLINKNSRDNGTVRYMPKKSKMNKIYYRLTGNKGDFGSYVRTKFHNGIKISKADNTKYLSFKDITSKIDELPKTLTKDVKKIKLYNLPYVKKDFQTLGLVEWDEPSTVHLFNSFLKKSSYLKTLTHELAHVLDYYYNSQLFSISNAGEWEKAFNKDKKQIINSGKTLENQGFVSSYGKRKYKKALSYKYPDPYKSRFSEDFADSVVLYLENKNEFIKNYPNRGKILEKILGV